MRHKKYQNDFKKMSLAERDQLFGDIKKGAYEMGGIFGGASPEREHSPKHQPLSPKGHKAPVQLFNHC